MDAQEKLYHPQGWDDIFNLVDVKIDQLLCDVARVSSCSVDVEVLRIACDLCRAGIFSGLCNARDEEIFG